MCWPTVEMPRGVDACDIVAAGYTAKTAAIPGKLLKQKCRVIWVGAAVGLFAANPSDSDAISVPFLQFYFLLMVAMST